AARGPGCASCTPAAAFRRHRDAGRWRVAHRDRAGAGASEPGDDQYLRPRRHRGPAGPGPPVDRDGGGVMDLDALLGDYLVVRRALGVKLAREEKLLRQFLTWLGDRGMQTITADAALAWARQPGEVSA